MTPSTLSRVSLLPFLLAAPARAQTVLWSDDFESGTSAWTTTGLWHGVDGSSACLTNVAPFPSGTHAMWYGAEASCNFDVGFSYGVLSTAATIALPAVHEGGVSLRYRLWRQAEQCGIQIGLPYDWTETHVHEAGGAYLDSQIECLSDSAWRKGRIDLTPYLGTSVRVLFSFYTVDDEQNGGRGLFIDDVSIELEAGLSYCENLGCACDSQTHFNSRLGGCRHSSSGLNGSELRGGGTPSVSADDVVLTVDAMPASSFVTFIQGDLAPAAPFGDGLLCIGGSLVRIAVRPSVGGAAVYPAPGEEALSVRGGIPAAGTTVGYQGCYRDSSTTWCTGATFNMTNAYRVVWIP